jgi:hypothetical protein
VVKLPTTPFRDNFRVANHSPRTQTLLSDNASVDPQIAAVLAPNRARAQCPGALPRCAPTLFGLTSALSGHRIRRKACLARFPVQVKLLIFEAAL